MEQGFDHAVVSSHEVFFQRKGKEMTRFGKTDILYNGVKAFRSRHPQIRRLKGIHSLSFQDFRVWASSWLLMDFLKGQGMRRGI